MSDWNSWIRQNAGLILLFGLAVYMTRLVLHMSHDNVDAASLGWGREQTSLVLGGFLGLITGRLSRGDRTPPDPPAAPAP